MTYTNRGSTLVSKGLSAYEMAAIWSRASFHMTQARDLKKRKAP
jgi:hypothetical protein